MILKHQLLNSQSIRKKIYILKRAVARWAKLASSASKLEPFVSFINKIHFFLYYLFRWQRLWLSVMEISLCVTLWPVWVTTYWPVDGIMRCCTSRSAKSWSNPVRRRYVLKLLLAVSAPDAFYFMFGRHKRQWGYIYCRSVHSVVYLRP